MAGMDAALDSSRGLFEEKQHNWLTPETPLLPSSTYEIKIIYPSHPRPVRHRRCGRGFQQ